MLFQRRLIYFPTQVAPNLADTMAAREGFRPWRNEAGLTIGWMMSAESGSTGAVMVVHGNAGAAYQRSYLAQPIHKALSVDIYVLEYPGYGARSGSPSQDSILAAAEEAFETLKGREPVYIVSESLGTGAAAHLARKYRGKIAGLALIAPYDKLTSVGQNQLSFLPVAWLMWDRFNPKEWLQDYGGPVKVVIAGADTIIPARFGRRLYDAYGGPKSIAIIQGAGHNDIASQSPEWWGEVLAFWQANGRGNR